MISKYYCFPMHQCDLCLHCTRENEKNLVLHRVLCTDIVLNVKYILLSLNSDAVVMYCLLLLAHQICECFISISITRNRWTSCGLSFCYLCSYSNGFTAFSAFQHSDYKQNACTVFRPSEQSSKLWKEIQRCLEINSNSANMTRNYVIGGADSQANCHLAERHSAQGGAPNGRHDKCNYA